MSEISIKDKVTYNVNIPGEGFVTFIMKGNAKIQLKPYFSTIEPILCFRITIINFLRYINGTEIMGKCPYA